MSIKKIAVIILTVVLVIGLGIGAKFMVDVQNYKDQVAALDIGEINLAEVPDGSYEGAYDADLIKVTVLVEVQNHRITDIELLQHDNGKGAPAEAIIPKVLKTQSLNVDAVSGATNSSKVILKAIEVALDRAG